MDDVEHFRVLFDNCYHHLHAYARRRASPADADDIVADTFTVAWRRLHDIPPGKELPWLYGVARRTLGNRRRSAARYLRLQRRLTAEPPPALADQSSNDRVRAALDRLPATDQEVLRLAAWEGLGTAEIAVVLECTANAAALRLSRARQRLRLLLTEPDATRTHAPTEAGDA